MEYIIIVLIGLLFIYFFDREHRYYRFKSELSELCYEYDGWLRYKKIPFDKNKSSYIFAYSKFPRKIPLKILFLSWTPINMNIMLTDEMRTKFSEFIKDTYL